MLDAREATLIVISLLSKWEAETGIAYVPVGEPVQHGRYWVQGYQSRAFVETGDFLAAHAGNGPVVVPRDGSAPFTLSSAEPTEPQMARILARDRGREEC